MFVLVCLWCLLFYPCLLTPCLPCLCIAGPVPAMTSFIPWYIFDAFRLIQSKVSRFESKFYLFLDTHLLISLYSLSEAVCLTSSCYHQTLWSSHQRRLFDPTESMWRRPKSKTSLFLNTHPVILISLWWSPFALYLLFVTSPCESRDEILFKGGSSVTLQNI